MAYPKPVIGTPLATNALTAKLRSLFPLLEGGPWQDWARPSNVGYTVGSGVGTSGGMASFNGNGYIGNFTDAYVPAFGAIPTLLVRCKANSDVPGPGNYRGLYCTNSYGLIQNYLYAWSNAGCAAGGGTVSSMHTVGYRAAAGGTEYFYDGAPSVVGAGCSPPFPNPTLASGPALGIGGSAATIDAFVGDIDYVAIFENVTDAEIAAFVADPWGSLFPLPPTHPAPEMVNSVPCCGTTGPTNLGPVEPFVGPYWIPSCTGGGEVPQEAPLVAAESWDY